MLSILLIQMSPKCESKTKPASRIDLDTAQNLNGTVFKRIWCSATDILRSANLSDWLKMLVDWEVKPNACDELIRPIKQDKIPTSALRVTVQDISTVRRNIDVSAEAAIYNSDKSEVTNITARTCAALQLIKSGKVVSLVWIPAIERD